MSFLNKEVFIKSFILGLAVGLFLSFGLYFAYSSNQKIRVDIGRALDQDVVYLNDGTYYLGWVNEGSSEVLIETKKGSFSLPRSACKRIEKDIFLKFVRKAI